MRTAGGASQGPTVTAARPLRAFSLGVLLLTTLSLGTSLVGAEAGGEIHIEFAAHGLVEAVHPEVTLSLTLTLSGESPKLLSGEGTYYVTPELQGRVTGVAVLGPDGALRFQGTAFIPGGESVFIDSGVEKDETAGPGAAEESFPGFISLKSPTTVFVGPIPPNSVFPGETLAFRGTGLMIALLLCSPDC